MRHNILSAFMLLTAAGVLATAGAALGQEGPAASPPRSTSVHSNGEKIRFNFAGATFEQVIDFFSRATGRPVIWQSPPPEGTLDYISPEAYDHVEALRVLNIILQSKGVMLRVSDDMLFLQKLTEMQKQDIPTFVGQLPDEITSDQVITVVRPLNIALAKPIAEKLAAMVASYGSVTAMEQQNALVITETAANVRRLLTIINQLDLEDPEGAVEIFSIHNAKASELMVPLKALLSQKVEKFVINQQGQQVKIEEDRMPGLTISSDDRTNSIIAKGQQSKIDKLRETIKLLDVQATAQRRAMTTISLLRITPAEAVAKLNQLFSKIPEKDRPVILAMDDGATKVVIIGDNASVDEGSMLLAELDGAPMNGGSGQSDSGANNNGESVVEVIALSRSQPQQVIAALNSLMSKRQQAVCKLLAGADGKSIVVSGFAGDVKSIKSLVPVLDRQSAAAKQVRLLRIAAGDPPTIVQQASKLLERQKDVDDQTGQWEIAIELDSESRTVTAIGAQRALDAFTNTLRMVEANVVVEREARQVRLNNVWPSEVLSVLQSLAIGMLQPSDGRQFVAPTFAAVDQLNAMVVTATPEQFAVIEPLIASLDSKSAAASTEVPPLRILSLRGSSPPYWSGADAASIANIINQQFNQRSAAERRAKPVNVVADQHTNSLIVAAHPDVLPQIQSVVDELNKTQRGAGDLESHEVRIFQLKAARAENVAPLVHQLLSGSVLSEARRGAARQRTQPAAEDGSARDGLLRIAAEPRLNAVIVAGPSMVVDLAEQMISQLDVDPRAAGSGGSRSVRVITVLNADAVTLAGNLEAIFSSPDEADVKPVIRVDASSNSLIVRSSDGQFETIQSVVSRIDQAAIASTQQMRTIPIDPSKSSAQDVAKALQRMLGQSQTAAVKVMTLEELMQQNEEMKEAE